MPNDPYDDILNIASGRTSPRPSKRESRLPDLLTFAEENELEVGSTTGGRHNKGSRHYSGNAIDVRNSGAFDDNQVKRLSEAASARGFLLRDERRRPQGQQVWGGPHVHVEVPRQDQQRPRDPYADVLRAAQPSKQKQIPGSSKPSATVPKVLTGNRGAALLRQYGQTRGIENIRRQQEEQVRAEVEKEYRARRGPYGNPTTTGALHLLANPVSSFTGLLRSDEENIARETEERLRQQRVAAEPEVESIRKEYGQMSAPVRSIAAPLIGRGSGGLLKVAGGVASAFGIAPNRLSEWANKRGEIIETGSSLPPLTGERGLGSLITGKTKLKEVERSVPEKITTGLADLGVGLGQIILLKKATKLPFNQLLALEAAAKNSGKPASEQLSRSAEAYALGTALDRHLSRPVSAAIAGIPTAAQTGYEMSQGRMLPLDAAIQTGIQAGSGAILTSPRPKQQSRQAPETFTQRRIAKIEAEEPGTSHLRRADIRRRVNEPLEDLFDEPQSKVQPSVEAQRAEAERQPATATPEETVRMGGRGRAEASAPVSSDVSTSSETQPARFFHRDYGEVVESPNQRRVGRRRVRVEAEDGSVHVIKRSDLRGRGNALAVPIRPSEIANPDTALVKGAPNSVVSDAHQLRNLVNGAAFREKGFSGLDVPSQRIMLNTVLRLSREPQVRDAVIEFIPVNVMNDLARVKDASQVFLHDPTMRFDRLSLERKNKIALPVDVADTLVRSVASLTAKPSLTPAQAAWPNQESVTADRTVDTDAVELGHRQTITEPTNRSNVKGRVPLPVESQVQPATESTTTRSQLAASPKLEVVSGAASLPRQAVKGFTTSQGSTYTVSGQSTQRTKAPHVGHDPKDVGLKPSSEKTIYLDEDAAREVGIWNTLNASGKRIAIRGNEVLLTSLNPKTNQRGLDGRFRFTTEPEVGKSPLELRERSVSLGRQNMEGYRWNHPGTPIKEIQTGTASLPETAPTIPERPETLALQLQALSEGRRDAVLAPRGTPEPSRPRSMARLETPVGVFYFNPRKTSASKIQRKVNDGSYGELLGHVAEKPRAGEPTAVVTAREGDTEVQSSAVPPERATEQVRATQQQNPRAEIEVGGPELAGQVISERLTGQRERGFARSTERAGLPVGESRYYDPITHKQSLLNAEQRISDLGVEGALRELTRKKDIDADDVATGIRLMQKLNASGETGRSAEVADYLQKQLTKSGQASSAASIISRLSPEGVLMVTQKNLPKGEKLTHEQSASLVAMAQRVQQAEARVADLQECVTTLEREPRSQSRPRTAERIGTIETRLKEMEEAARARLNARKEQAVTLGSQSGASTIPLDIADYAIIGASKIAQKGMSSARWTAEMISEFGEEIRPRLKSIYRESYKLYDEQKRELGRQREERSAVRSVGGPVSGDDLNQLIAQRAQARSDARKARAEMGRLYQQLTRTRGEKIKAEAVDILGLPRSIKSSMDLSAPRQGAMWMLNHPVQGVRLFFGKQLQAMKETNYDKFVDQLESDPDFPLMMKSRLALTTPETQAHNLTAREEAFASRLAGRIPGVKHSERAYTTFLDTARVSWFKQLKGLAEQKAQSEGRTLGQSDYNAIADFVNISTGRGNLGQGKLNNISPVLNALFFAPKFAISKVQAFDPRVYARLPAGARKQALREAATYYGGMASVALLLKFGLGLSVGLDPEDSEFMKFKVGNTRYDLSNGTGQYVRLAAQLLRNVENKRTGKKDAFGHSVMENADRFLRYKYSPPAGFVRNVWEGKNPVGEKTSAGKEAVELVTPLFLNDVYEAFQKEGLSGAAKTTPGFVGVGVQTYTRKPKRAVGGFK